MCERCVATRAGRRVRRRASETSESVSARRATVPHRSVGRVYLRCVRGAPPDAAHAPAIGPARASPAARCVFVCAQCAIYICLFSSQEDNDKFWGTAGMGCGISRKAAEQPPTLKNTTYYVSITAVHVCTARRPPDPRHTHRARGRAILALVVDDSASRSSSGRGSPTTHESIASSL